MNLLRVRTANLAGVARRTARAFTMPEMMIVMSIFTLLVLALVSCQLFGMRMQRISETKLAGTAAGRKALNQVRNEILQGKILTVGNGNNLSFTPVPDNNAQIGNALQISFTTNTGSYVRYYLDTNDNNFKRTTSLNSTPLVLASFITNQMVFQAEDYRGTVLTDNKNNRVIHMMLAFYRWEYPIATAGSGGMYDYFQLQTRITRRTIE
jgi:prepilin-type N-terminal cleavage/methylation domain-containing protein